MLFFVFPTHSLGSLGSAYIENCIFRQVGVVLTGMAQVLSCSSGAQPSYDLVLRGRMVRAGRWHGSAGTEVPPLARYVV